MDWSVVISNKISMHEFPHQMPNNLRLGILENYEYQENLKHSRNFGPAPSLPPPPPPPTLPPPPPPPPPPLPHYTIPDKIQRLSQIFRLRLQQTQASVNAFCKLCRYHTTSIKVDNLLGVLTLSKTQFPITLP